jgi:hypothetical protein
MAKSMQAQVTIKADVNILALQRILAENGLWLVHVHNKSIVHATKVPRAVDVDDLVAEWMEDARDLTTL